MNQAPSSQAFMWWSKKQQTPAPEPEPVSQAEQKRLQKKCVAPLKALKSCKRANPDLPLAYARLESRVVECYAEVRFLPAYVIMAKHLLLPAYLVSPVMGTQVSLLLKNGDKTCYRRFYYRL